MSLPRFGSTSVSSTLSLEQLGMAFRIDDDRNVSSYLVNLVNSLNLDIQENTHKVSGTSGTFEDRVTDKGTTRTPIDLCSFRRLPTNTPVSYFAEGLVTSLFW